MPVVREMRGVAGAAAGGITAAAGCSRNVSSTSSVGGRRPARRGVRGKCRLTAGTIVYPRIPWLEIAALDVVHPQVPQHRQAFGRLDALGDGLLAQRLGDIEDGLERRLNHAVARHVVRQGAVNLEEIEGEIAEFLEGVEILAEVVNREAATAALDRLGEGDGV